VSITQVSRVIIRDRYRSFSPKIAVDIFAERGKLEILWNHDSLNKSNVEVNMPFPPTLFSLIFCTHVCVYVCVCV
jgi:hypothetical protein